jgi:DNA-binding protein HU-beta
MNLNKSELIDALAAKSDITKVAAANALDGLLEVITETLVRGDGISLIGFGTFTVGERAARTGRNPQTGAELKIPASRVAKFSAGQKLKSALNSDKDSKTKKK